MACIITYKNNKYSQQEFEKYFKNNFNEFINEFLSQDIEGFKEFVKNAPVEFKGEGVYYQLSSAQKTAQTKILETRNVIRKEEKKEEVDPIFMDTEEANNWYVKISSGEKVKRRVTDRVKAWFRSKFPDKVFSKSEIERNNFKREFGIKGHAILQDIHARFFDVATGEIRSTPLNRPVFQSEFDETLYNKLEKYFIDLIKIHTKNDIAPMVFSEEIIYDNREDEAGTLDLLIIDSDGVGNIFDWKFMETSDNSEDLPWFKFGAFNIQLKRYREILEKRYDIKINMNRAIPILIKIATHPKTKDLSVSGIAIGSADPTKISNLKLIPVSEEKESTGEKTLDKIIAQLNDMLKQAGKKDTPTDEEYELKSDRLKLLRKAIHLVQGAYNISPLIDVIIASRNDAERILNEYESHFKNKSLKDFDKGDKTLSEFSADIREYLGIAEILSNSAHLLGDLIYNEQMEKDAKTKEEKEYLKEAKKVLDQLSKESSEIAKLRLQIEDVAKEFADKYIGQRNMVAGLLNAEPVLKGLEALFRGVSEIPLKSARLVYKMINIAKGKAVKDAEEKVNKILEIRKRIVERGGDVRTFIQQLYQKDEKGNIHNKLIHKFKKEFYNELRENALPENQKKKWILDNIDVEEYKKEAEELLKKRIERHERLYKNDEETLQERILEEKRKWDIDRKDFNGWNNYILARHPLQKWESEEYLKIKNDKELFDLYNFITTLNKEAADNGYISNRIRSTFLPFIRKSMAESLAWDFDISAIKNIGKSLTMNPDDVGYGKFNNITEELENSIPKYFTYDFTRKDNGDVDFSEVSEDLFKNLIIYASHVEKYKYLVEIEEQIKLIKTVETFKGCLNTSRSGNVIDGQELGGNAQNVKLLDDYIRVLLYDQKYPVMDSDAPIGTGKVIGGVKKLITSVTGHKFKETEEPSVTSLTKLMDATNKAFQLKTLGLEVLSGAANLFGTNIQLSTQSGKYFSAREVLKNEMMLLQNSFRNSDEREMFIQLMDVFMPLKESPIYDKLKSAGLTKLTRQNFSDILMMFMKYPEEHVEKSIFLTLLDNMMVKDGKIVSIRTVVKNKYPNRSVSSEQYKDIQKRIDEEVKELQKASSINATKKLVDGKLVIPGLNLENQDEILRLTSLTRRLSRNATGGLSDADVNRMSMNVWTRSMMVFKNWIPKLIDTRFSEFRKTGDDFSIEIDEEGHSIGEQYDVGRVRLFFNLLSSSLLEKSNNIYNILVMNDKGLEKLDRLFLEYAADYKKRTGEELNMSKDDFVDLIKNNLRNQMKELSILLSLIGVLFGLGVIVPDDEDDKATKNFHSYVRRAVDKFVSELSFFYNPLEFQKLLSGSAFPAIGLVADVIRFSSHLSMEITGFDISNLDAAPEEVRKKAQPIKNLSRMLPVTKPAFTWAGILSDEFAEEFDVTLSNQARKW